MGLQYIRDFYGVPAKRGMEIEYNGECVPVFGRITSAREGYIRVRLKNTKKIISLHPTWKVKYIWINNKEAL